MRSSLLSNQYRIHTCTPDRSNLGLGATKGEGEESWISFRAAREALRSGLGAMIIRSNILKPKGVFVFNFNGRVCGESRLNERVLNF